MADAQLSSVVDYPDEELNPLQLSLLGFTAIAQQLFGTVTESNESRDSFIRFVLAGRLGHSDTASRVFMNARQGVGPPPKNEYSLRRDFDSLIGITRDLPFACAMAVFPLPSFRDTLKKDNHLTANAASTDVGVSVVSVVSLTLTMFIATACTCPAPPNSEHGTWNCGAAPHHTGVLSPHVSPK